MQLFMVIYITGLIGGTVGPLPYGFDECEARAAAATREAAQQVSVVTPSGVTGRDVRLACEYHSVRPANTFR